MSVSDTDKVGDVIVNTVLPMLNTKARVPDATGVVILPSATIRIVLPTAKKLAGSVRLPAPIVPKIVVAPVEGVVTSDVWANIPQAVKSPDFVSVPADSDTMTPDAVPVAKSGLRAVVRILVYAVSL